MQVVLRQRILWDHSAIKFDVYFAIRVYIVYKCDWSVLIDLYNLILILAL